MKKFKLIVPVTFLLFSYTTLQASTCLDTLPESTPLVKFTDLELNQDIEVIEDYKTGLMWARCFWGSSWDISSVNCELDSDATISWKAALKAVDIANSTDYLGYSDWRMPNIKELASIVEYQCFRPAINEAVFPLSGFSAEGSFWTNTPVYGGTSIRLINFISGQVVSQDYTTQNYLRLVRDVPAP